MKRQLLLAAPMALLFACSGSAVSLQPGQWETTVQMTQIDMPGAPPEAAGMMRALMGQPQTHSACMTPEQAANPMSRLAAGEDANNCTFSENTFAGGRIKVRGTCQSPARGTMSMNWEGTYTATTMEARVSSEMHAPPGTPGPQAITMSGTMRGHRTGDCAASPPANKAG